MNTRSAFLVAAGLLLACSCSKADKTNATSAPANSSPPKTAFDQKENPADLALTQQVRKALVADDGLSAMSKNVTVVTQNGRVTLEGTVASADEKARIGELAVSIAGAGKVDNRINVQPR